MVNKRKLFQIVQGWLEADKLVFLDESGVHTDMTRLYGRSIGKKRVEDHVPLNKGKRTTIISSVRLDGTTVPVTITGAMNGKSLRTISRIPLYRHCIKVILWLWIIYRRIR